MSDRGVLLCTYRMHNKSRISMEMTGSYVQFGPDGILCALHVDAVLSNPSSHKPSEGTFDIPLLVVHQLPSLFLHLVAAIPGSLI